MRSWVRYSVSAYMGLLLAGSIAAPGTAPPRADSMASINQRSAPPPQPAERYYLVPAAPQDSDRLRADS